MGKQYNSVRAMIKEMDTDAGFKEKAELEIENRQISKFLVVLRCTHGLTQKQLAGKAGCTQSRVSKIEASYDTEISVKDMIDYGKALNLKLEIGYRKPTVKIVDLIKYHAGKISFYLNQLVEIARDKDDESINEGVFNFFKEAIVNINALILKPYSKLTFPGKSDKNIIHISAPLDAMESISNGADNTNKASK
jgi:transcriptional regulator with XRE-family HTH domain